MARHTRVAASQDRRVGARYYLTIDRARGVGASVYFRTRGPEVVEYSLVLLLHRDDRVWTIRVYDSAHGFNEMHRYTRLGGKQRGVEIHRGTLGEGMRAAIEEIKSRYLAMIEGWER
ncbi:MAG TPA: hypothetical protein VH703_02890 [Solirubrobacterales bacterium]